MFFCPAFYSSINYVFDCLFLKVLSQEGFCPKGYSPLSGDIVGCHNLGEGGPLASNKVEAKDLRDPEMLLSIPMPAPHNQEIVEKSWPRLIPSNQRNFIYRDSEGVRRHIHFPSLSGALNTLKRWNAHKAATLSGHCHKGSSHPCPSSALELGVWWDLYTPECNRPLWFLPSPCFRGATILRWILIDSGGGGRWG